MQAKHWKTDGRTPGLLLLPDQFQNPSRTAGCKAQELLVGVK